MFHHLVVFFKMYLFLRLHFVYKRRVLSEGCLMTLRTDSCFYLWAIQHSWPVQMMLILYILQVCTWRVCHFLFSPQLTSWLHFSVCCCLTQEMTNFPTLSGRSNPSEGRWLCVNMTIIISRTIAVIYMWICEEWISYFLQCFCLLRFTLCLKLWL